MLLITTYTYYTLYMNLFTVECGLKVGVQLRPGKEKISPGEYMIKV